MPPSTQLWMMHHQNPGPNSEGPARGLWRKRGRSTQAIGRSRGGWTTKVRALTDVIGRPYALMLTAGNVRDIKAAAALLQRAGRTRYDKDRYCGRHLIENAFCRRKDFRRVATRYDKLAANFLSGVAPATTLPLWL